MYVKLMILIMRGLFSFSNEIHDQLSNFEGPLGPNAKFH